MRSTQTCPKCAGKKFAVTAQFQIPYPHVPNGGLPLPAIILPASVGARHLGQFESWICVACGYTELYAQGWDDLDALAKQFPEYLRIVDARPPEQGPYR